MGAQKTARAAPASAGGDPQIEQLGSRLDILTEAGELVAIHDMPTLEDGAKGRRAVNPALFANIIYGSHATLAFCELVGPRPTDSTTGAFGFGRSRGIIEGVLAAAGIPLTMIAPPVWKRTANIAPGKENKDSARSVAISRWPSQAMMFARKCDCDRAEAALARAMAMGVRP